MTEIEVFADVRCPFTHVGLRRLVERRAAEGKDVPLRVRAWPLELVNGAPLDARLIAEEVDELRQQVAPDLFTGFDVARFPDTSIPALVLAAAAYDHGAWVGEGVSLALRRALFEEGRDIATPAVLLDIASAAGIPLPERGCRQQVLDDWREGQERGVVGSPHFFVGGDSYFCPTLDITKVDGHLRITRDEAGLSGFLDECFR
jgi:predicted DsbA family dithiol-disulfide isomerase